MPARRTIAVVGALLLAIGRPAAAEPVDEEGLIVVEIPGIATRDVIVRIAGDSLYLPFADILSLLSIDGGATVAGDSLWGAFPADNHFAVSVPARSVRARDSVFSFESPVALVRDGVPFIAREALETALGISLVFIPEDLRLRIDNDPRLPVVDAVTRAKRYASLEFYRSEQERLDRSAASFVAGRPLFGSAFIEWSASGTAIDGASAGLLASRISAPLFGGVVELGGYGTFSSAPLAHSAFELQSVGWRLPIEGSSLLRSVSIASSGSALRRHYRLELSNAPALRPMLFDEYVLSGRTQPEWTVELERGDQLVDVVRTDSSGDYSFVVPVRYGSSVLTVRELGPHGQSTIRPIRFSVPPTFLPPGSIEYTTDIGLDDDPEAKTARGSARLNVGISEWMTIDARGEYQSTDLGHVSLDSIRPVFRLLLRTGGFDMAAGYDGITRALVGEATLQLSASTRIRAMASGLAPWRDEARCGFTIQAYPAGVGLSLTGQYVEDSAGARTEISPQLSTQVLGIGLSASTRLGTSTHAGEMPFRPLATTLQVSSLFFSKVFAYSRVSVDHVRDVVERAELSAMLPLGPWLRLGLSAGAEYTDGYRGFVRGELGVEIAELRLTAQSDYRRGTLEHRVLAEGLLAMSASGLRLSRDGGGRESAIALRAYDDRDLDGIWDPDEPQLGAPHATLWLDGDDAGAVRGERYDLIAEADYWGEIDRWSLADEGWYPRWRNFSVYLLPSTLHTIDVPYARGVDLTGRCVIAGDASTVESPSSNPLLNGLRVRLREVDGCGDYDGEVFSDGTLTIEGVAPGTYRIEMDAAQLAFRGLTVVASTDVTVTTDSRDLPLLTLRPATMNVPGKGLPR